MTTATPADRIFEVLVRTLCDVPADQIDDREFIARLQEAAGEIDARSLHGDVKAIADLIARADYEAELATLNVVEVSYCALSARTVATTLADLQVS
jgi:hypothetical protein